MQYGDKRDFPKIDIFVNGEYAASTSWARTCREAIERFDANHPQLNHEIGRVRRITANFAKKGN